MQLAIYKNSKARLPRRRLIRLFELIAAEEAEPDDQSTINLIVTTDQQLRRLNAQYRKKDKPTDVLSFNIERSGDLEGTFGEIYISSMTATRQARDYGATLSEELIRLACHGLLHLFGYDHIKTRDAVIMKEREKHFLSVLEG
jgi:probable rRNA maturation factor